VAMEFGARGFEPRASASQTQRSARLSYAPNSMATSHACEGDPVSIFAESCPAVTQGA
jgi:hypothetical protein